MTPRHFIYGRLTGYAPLSALVPADRVWAKRSMTSSIEETPYIVYKLGNETTNNFSEEVEIDTQFFQVWVHDYSDGNTADYDRIDAVLREVRAAFRHQVADGNWGAVYLETSQDFSDETLNTVVRYARFQLVKEEV